MELWKVILVWALVTGMLICLHPLIRILERIEEGRVRARMERLVNTQRSILSAQAIEQLESVLRSTVTRNLQASVLRLINYYTSKEQESEALTRSRALLLEYLDDEQKKEFFRSDTFWIPSKIFIGIKYHIGKGIRPKVYLKGDLVCILCIDTSSRFDLPVFDRLLSHLLWIQGDEQRYIREANIYDIGDGYRSVYVQYDPRSLTTFLLRITNKVA